MSFRFLPSVFSASLPILLGLFAAANHSGGAGLGIESRPLPVRAMRTPGNPLFESIPPERSGIQFQIQLPDLQKHIHEMIHLSVYGGLCTGDYDGDGLTDIYFTSPVGGNRLFRNLGNFRFEDVTVKTGILDTNFWGTGATFTDIDNDGDLDIYACGYRVPNRLYINQGSQPDRSVRFSEQAARFGLAFQGASMTMAFADMDGDGDLDAYLATTAVPPPPGVTFKTELQNNRPVVPKELQEYWGLIYLPGDRVHVTEAGQRDRLYRNDGGQFTDVTAQAGIGGAFFTLSAIWWDYNGDQHPDLYVANDYLGPDLLYRNNGDGTFTDVIRDVIPHTPWSSMGVDIADLNNDGFMDLMATDMLGSTHLRRQVMQGEISKTGWFLDVAEPRQYVRNAVYLNSGAGRVWEAAYQTGLAATDWTWGPRIEDFDNDGWSDVFIANGMLRDVQNADLGLYADRVLGGGSPRWAQFWASQPLLKETNFVFRNLGNLQFLDASREWGLDRLGVSLGAATADFDNDGDLDLAVHNADAPPSIYQNHSSTGSLVRVRLIGRSSNREGIGATVRLRAGELSLMRTVSSARSWLSSSEASLHFGLGNSTNVDRLTVEWPGGRRQSFENLSANHLYTITEPLDPPSSATHPAIARANGFQPTNWLDQVRHNPGAPFDDFAREPLLPRKISARAFCIAWGDANGDGKPDAFVGGGKGAPAQLWIQEPDGRFILSTQPALNDDRDSVDAAALFIDFDADSDLDLFVVSGGNHESPGHPSYRDRVYINNGHGQLSKAPDSILPDLRSSGSCIAMADFDRDGDQDLFVGGASEPGRYPFPSPSHLLVNQNGKFLDHTPEPLKTPGIVSDASWADIDGNGTPELVLAIEWGSIQVFQLDGGRAKEGTEAAGLAGFTGWWFAIAAGDIDRDGDIDLVAGNQGLNSRYRAQPAQPEMLFHGDLAGLGRSNLLEARFIGELGYPHRGLDVLSQSMPSLKEKFPSFDQFARAPIENVFSMQALRQATRREATTLESGAFINDGKGRFRLQPLPTLAQLAPARDLAIADLDEDGTLDLVIAQNDYSPNRETGRMDGGMSLVLRGNGNGAFEAVPPHQSGIVVPGEALSVTVLDLDQNGKPDVVFGLRGAGLHAFAR